MSVVEIPLACLPADDVECRVLAAVLVEPAKLALANDLEDGDFVSYRHRAVFALLRNLQADGVEPTVDDIAEAVVLDGNPTLTLDWLGELFKTAPTYETTFGIEAWQSVFAADLRELRLTAIARGALR